MTTKEFIKKVRELGLKAEDMGDEFHVYIDKDTLATVSKNKTYNIDTNWHYFQELKDEVKEKLFSILIEYTSTPLDERDGTLYYLKLKRIPLGQDRKKNYLNYNTRIGMFDLEDDIEMDGWKSTFTKREVKLMDEEYDILKDYEMIEVK